MRFRSRALLVAAVGALFLLAAAVPVLGADTANSEFVIIREGDTFSDDLYTGAVRVVVDGTIDGDLIAFAGEEVVVNGTVTGSIFAIAPNLTINGEVGGSVRVTGSSIDIEGNVDGDLVGSAFWVDLHENSVVDGDVLLWAWNVELLGSVGEDVTGSYRSLGLAGSVAGDVDVSVGKLTIVGPLTVAGDLGYRSAQEATGLELADVDGAIVHKSPLDPNIRVRALGLLGRFMVILFLTVAALGIAWSWPKRTEKAVSKLASRPLRSWGIGALLLLAPLAFIGLAFLLFTLAPAAAAFPLLLILAPIGIAIFGITFAVSVVAGAPVAAWLGGVLFKKFDLYGAILAGGLLIGLLWYLPIVGLFIPLVVLPAGLGAWVLSRRQGEASKGL